MFNAFILIFIYNLEIVRFIILQFRNRKIYNICSYYHVVYTCILIKHNAATL